MKTFRLHPYIAAFGIFLASFGWTTVELIQWQHRIDNPVVRDRELEKWQKVNNMGILGQVITYKSTSTYVVRHKNKAYYIELSGYKEYWIKK